MYVCKHVPFVGTEGGDQTKKKREKKGVAFNELFGS